MRTRFVSVVRSRAFRARAWVWAGVAAVLATAALTGLLFWLSGHHLVKTEKGLVVVSKRFVGLAGTRVDIRGWTWSDAAAHADLCQALTQAGYGDLLPKPPPEPTAMERAAEKAKVWRNEAVTASSNAWQRVKAKAAEWQAGAEKETTEAGGQKPK